MTVATVITFGYGTFGTVNFLPTLGYGTYGSTPTPTPTPGRSGLGGDDVPRRNPNRGWDKEEWQRRRKDPIDAIEATLKQAYAELTGESAPISVLAKVEAIVKPVAKVARGQPHVIDWTRLSAEYARVNALIRLWQEERDLQAEIEDDDDFLMMMQ